MSVLGMFSITGKVPIAVSLPGSGIADFFFFFSLRRICNLFLISRKTCLAFYALVSLGSIMVFFQKVPSALFKHTSHFTMMFFLFLLQTLCKLSYKQRKRRKKQPTKTKTNQTKNKQTKIHHVQQVIFQQLRSLLFHRTISVMNVYMVQQ